MFSSKNMPPETVVPVSEGRLLPNASGAVNKKAPGRYADDRGARSRSDRPAPRLLPRHRRSDRRRRLLSEANAANLLSRVVMTNENARSASLEARAGAWAGASPQRPAIRVAPTPGDSAVRRDRRLARLTACRWA